MCLSITPLHSSAYVRAQQHPGAWPQSRSRGRHPPLVLKQIYFHLHRNWVWIQSFSIGLHTLMDVLQCLTSTERSMRGGAEKHIPPWIALRSKIIEMYSDTLCGSSLYLSPLFLAFSQTTSCNWKSTWNTILWEDVRYIPIGFKLFYILQTDSHKTFMLLLLHDLSSFYSPAL